MTPGPQDRDRQLPLRRSRQLLGLELGLLVDVVERLALVELLLEDDARRLPDTVAVDQWTDAAQAAASPASSSTPRVPSTLTRRAVRASTPM